MLGMGYWLRAVGYGLWAHPEGAQNSTREVANSP